MNFRLFTIDAFLAITLAAISAHAADCVALNKQADEKAARLPDNSQFFKVLNTSFLRLGPGRLYFYTAPDDACRNPEVFVLPGEEIVGYATMDGFTKVMYISANHSQVSTGWVKTEGLAYTGMFPAAGQYMRTDRNGDSHGSPGSPK